MHVPDGFLTAPTCAALGVVAVGVVAYALRASRRELDDRTAPLAGLVATFVFAAQMLNFPVGAGTSGHLLGGALAAALVGPWTGVLCVTVVVIVQAFLFADGGITALGANVVLLALVGVGVGWLSQRGIQRLLPRRLSMVQVSAALGAFISVVAASLAFSAMFALGGTVSVPVPTLVGAMVGVHTLIGLGEAVITGLAVGAVLTARPDLVRAARPVLTARSVDDRTGAPA